MTFWLVVWIQTSYDCPWGLGKAPRVVHELACSKHETMEYFVSSQKAQTIRKVEELGASARPLVIEFKGTRSRKISPHWKPEL